MQKQKLIPSISSRMVSPTLNIAHLPRLHEKLMLASVGALADGYAPCGKGFDAMVLSGLNLNREATIKFIHTNRPTLQQLENWIAVQPGATLGLEDIANLNKAIAGYNHDLETREAILTAAGINIESGPDDAVSLNEIDDHTARMKSLENESLVALSELIPAEPAPEAPKEPVVADASTADTNFITKSEVAEATPSPTPEPVASDDMTAPVESTMAGNAA